MKKQRATQVIVSASIGACFLLFASISSGSNFGYSTLGIDLVNTIFDDDACVPHRGGLDCYDGVAGLSLSGSYQASENIVLRLSANYQQNDSSNTEINASGSGVGLGFVQGVGTQTDIGIAVDFVWVEAEVCSHGFCVKEDDTGIGLSAFARHWVNPRFEINGGVARVNLSDFGDETGVSVGLAGWFTEHSSIRGGVTVADDSTSFSLGYLYTFGR